MRKTILHNRNENISIDYFHDYAKSRVAHAPGMPRTFSPPPRVSDPDMHHGTCVTHVPWCIAGSVTSGFLWTRWREKRSRHSRRMRNPQCYVSGKRPMEKGYVLIFYISLLHVEISHIGEIGLIRSPFHRLIWDIRCSYKTVILLLHYRQWRPWKQMTSVHWVYIKQYVCDTTDTELRTSGDWNIGHITPIR